MDSVTFCSFLPAAYPSCLILADFNTFTAGCAAFGKGIGADFGAFAAGNTLIPVI